MRTDTGAGQQSVMPANTVIQDRWDRAATQSVATCPSLRAPHPPKPHLAGARVLVGHGVPSRQPLLRLCRQRQLGLHAAQRQQRRDDHAGGGAPAPHLAVEHEGGAGGRVPAALQQRGDTTAQGI